MLHWLLTIAFSAIFSAASVSAQVQPIDTTRSKLKVHVSKAGVLRAFGDDHDIEAPVSEGFVDEAAARVRLVVESRRMRVLDPQLAADKRQQVQERMLGPDVLDAPRYPRIVFESRSVERMPDRRMIVRGELSLHGATRTVVVPLRQVQGEYRGTCSFKQTDFGIQPVSVAGGTVRVKDELKIEFVVQTGVRR